MREFKNDRLVNVIYRIAIITFAGLAIALTIEYYTVFNIISQIVANTNDIPAVSGLY
jgi:hypothetical protein